ncbi:MAG: gliding motility lipoprotein GldB [Capnocytophaga sp.]|nr:gliding motility lipoprotein GldB [Capnocytophaga sp.]
MKIIFRTFFLFCAIFFLSCGDSKEKEIAKIPMEINIERFDKIFFQTPENEIVNLKQKFPFLFPENTPDSIWIEKQRDTLQQELFEEVSKTFPDFSKEEQQIKYYFPAFKPPKVITLTTDVDYMDSRVIYADSLLFIGLDNYLGKEHHFYSGIQDYIREELEKKYIPIDVALTISEVIIPKTRNTTFLESMIYEGKLLYMAKEFFPEASEEDLLKYSSVKYQWAVENEAEIWRYFIENQLLYSTDKKVLNRFIEMAPFSKFYMEIDNESPGGIGRFIGLQIVKQFMKKYPDLQKMGALKTEEIFKEANYKPKK